MIIVSRRCDPVVENDMKGSCKSAVLYAAVTLMLDYNPKRNQPAYLADLLDRPKCSKCLSSTNSYSFVVPRIKTKIVSRAFSISGPAL